MTKPTDTDEASLSEPAVDSAGRGTVPGQSQAEDSTAEPQLAADAGELNESVKDSAADEDVLEETDDEDDFEPSWWEDVRDFYLSIDRRTLGLVRIMLALYLIFDLFRRTGDWWRMFSNDGVLPTHFNLWRPQSSGWTFLNAFAHRGELWVLWGVILFVYLMLLVGYRTKVWQVAAAILVASMNGRVLLIENGGYVVQNLLLLWTAFLPLGDRFSLDALLASMKSQREGGEVDLNDRSTDTARWRLESHVSVVALVMVLQLSAIYGFNVVHKTGPAWHNGTAVHYVLYVDRMVNPLIAQLRAHTPFWVIIILTKSVMAMEAGLPLVLLSPLARVWAKRLVIVFMNALHIGFGSTFVLGPFAWALCVFSLIFVSTEDWELMIRTMRRVHRRRVVLFDPTHEASLFWCRVLKRLDKFRLLRFETAAGLSELAVRTPAGERLVGTRATADIVSALPGGAVFGQPMRWPGLLQLSALLGRIVSAIGGLFWSPHRTQEHEAAAQGRLPQRYCPELRDDDEEQRIDAYFMHDWIDEKYGWWKVRLGGALAMLGGFFYIYGMPMAQRLKIDTKALGTREQATRIMVILGLVLFVLGAVMFCLPFIRMNWRTPSSLKRKGQRTLAFLREGLCILFVFGAINQALVELWVTRSLKAPQPTEMRTLSHKMRYLQGWFMFSPNPVMDDGVIVTDAITVDGRRIDPFSLEALHSEKLLPPNFDLLNAKSFGYNQIWSDYYNRMHMGGNTAFRKPMKEYIFRLQERTGNQEDTVVKGAVYWVHDMNPRWRSSKSWGFNRKQLFKFTNPNGQVQERYRNWKKTHGDKDPPEAPLPAPLPKTKARG